MSSTDTWRCKPFNLAMRKMIRTSHESKGGYFKMNHKIIGYLDDIAFHGNNQEGIRRLH